MCITMTANIASQFSNMNRNEVTYATFIAEKIEKAGGLVKFQHLTGHLSQLDMSIRQTVGASPSDLRKFLVKHKELFIVNSEGFVSCKKSPEAATDMNNQTDRVVTNSNRNDSDSLFPTNINDVPGIVIKVLPNYGFISIKNPVKTSVYFTPACVVDDKFQIGNENGRLLTDIADMLPGKKVRLNAKKANTSADAKYRALRVWTPKNVENEVLVPDGFHPKVPKDGLYDPVSIEGSGKVQNVFEQFGFITNDNNSEIIFFHKSKVCNVQNIMNLTKVFSPGDSVEFKAIRSKKQDKKIRWEASKVWIKKAGKTNLFKTEDSSGVECDSQSQKSYKKGLVGKNIEPKSRELIDAAPGKIYPHSDGVVIKFGKNDSELADADSCPFYLHGEKVQDVCWEFSDGDNVHFDGIKIKSAPGWKALLAWVGVKPNIVLPTHVGDFTEFSDDDSVSLHESIVPDLKSRIVRPLEFSMQAKRDQRSRTPNNRSRIFASSPTFSQVSNSSSRSHPKYHTSVDKDFDLLSDDTMSSISADSKPQAPVHAKRRNKRSKYHSKPIKKASSRSSLTDDTAMESEDSYTNHKTREFHNSRLSKEDASSNILSRATLTPSVSSESLDFEAFLKPSTSSESLDFRKCLQPNPDLFKNWGDTPFPGEEDNEALPATEEITSLSNATQLKEDFNNIKLEKEINESCSSPTKSPPPEIFNSDDEFSDAVETTEDNDREVKSQEPEDFESENKRNLLKELSNSDGEAKKEAESKSYVKFFRDLEGKILKVFWKFAEIEHDLLKKSVSVLWSDLYYNGIPVADKFEDMREVIKPGQTIKFNCIEVMDDAGSCWQKVTVAWKGQQPKVKEITPKEYINKNFLSITVDENEIEYCSQETSQITGLNTPTESEPTVAAPPRKFLFAALCCDEEEEKSNESLKGEDKASNLDGEKTLQEERQVKSGEKDLYEAIGEMILNFAVSETDIETLSKDIINLVRGKSGMTDEKKQPSTSSASSEVIVHNKENQTCSADSFSLPLKKVGEMTNSETQTIITGDIIAQSLFTISVQHLQ